MYDRLAIDCDGDVWARRNDRDLWVCKSEGMTELDTDTLQSLYGPVQFFAKEETA